MNKEKEHKKIVPALRFPEFEGEWEEKNLDDVCGLNPSSSSLPQEFIYIDLESVESGNLLKKRKISFENAPSRAQRLLTKGDSIFQMVRPYQRNNYFFNPTDNLRYVASTGYAQLRAFQSKTYLFQYIHNDDFVNRVLAKCTGSNYPAINSRDLAKIKVLIPENPQEQQKIAHTLTSLDHLITAENEKLDALQAHKKGLLQQLFPAKGERVPKVRFGEFRGEWEECNFYDLLIDIIDFRGRTPKKLDMDWGGGDIVSLSANNVKNGFIDFKAECNLGSRDLYEKWMGKVNLEKNDIVFTMEAPLGKALLIPNSEKYILSQRVVAFKTKDDIINEFLIQLIWSFQFQSSLKRLSTGSTAKGINQKTLKTIDVRLPKEKKEQQKIANCLSSLDDTIAAQSEKIAALQEHKKALMQGMFPVV